VTLTNETELAGGRFGSAHRDPSSSACCAKREYPHRARPGGARKIQPGQFIILRSDERGERMPLTVADWDREAGTETCIFMQVGTSTQKLAAMKPGDRLPTFVGPLGHPMQLENFGTVVLTGGCYGIALSRPPAERAAIP
jgi:NAD(P)H-flavin reductase